MERSYIPRSEQFRRRLRQIVRQKRHVQRERDFVVFRRIIGQRLAEFLFYCPARGIDFRLHFGRRRIFVFRRVFHGLAGVVQEYQIILRRKRVNLFYVLVRNVFHRFAHRNAVAGVLVTFDKLPQCKAFVEILVFQNRVRPHHRRADIIFIHRLHERRLHIPRNNLVQPLHSVPKSRAEERLARRFFRVAFGIFHFDFNSASALAVFERAFEFEIFQFFVRARLFGNLRPLAYKKIQPADQRIQKFVFVR